MTTEKEERDLATMNDDILLQCRDIMKSQGEQNLQISRKTSYMIGSLVFIMLLLSIGVVTLTISQKNDMNKMNEYMEGMTKNITIMSGAVVKMQKSMSTIEGGIYRVSNHAQSISHLISEKENLTGTLLNIADTVSLMQRDAHGLGKSMGDVNYNLGAINKQMKSLNRKLGFMVKDANRMPSPTNMFPF